ncbi:MAG: DUF2062 domain-containing protein [Gammaproteobacteria bacterium]|nr:MAG: DUF2062 domain-containing protein [Gammaproteobacteria bacterium]HDY81481.1 DUF2062 domain-containing protein [Halieaceae bacterium]
MPKKTLKRFIPSPARVREVKSLHLLGDWIYAGNLWHINRYSASMAFFIGLFVAFMPIPGQMVLAALLAVLTRCNLPLSVGLVWITNPLTMPGIFYLSYKVGAMIIDVPLQDIQFELSFHWLSNSLTTIWRPFLLGCLICGLFFGSMGYFTISMLWRWRVAFRWRERKRKRAAEKLNRPD